MTASVWRNLGISLYVLGFIIPLFASKGQGMPVEKYPVITALWVILWLVGWYCLYRKALITRNYPSGTALWLKVCNYISDYTPMFLISAFLTAANFYPTGLAIQLPQKQMTFVSLSLLVMGMAIPLDEWKRILKRPIPVFQLWAVRWICMPLIALGLALIIFGNFVADKQIASQLIAAQVLVGTTTTGGASNVYTFLVGGDAPLSVMTTALSTLTDPLLQPPAASLLIGTLVDVPVKQMMIDLLKGVIIPLIIGVAISTALFKNKVKKYGPLFGAVSVIIMFPLFLGAFCGGWSALLKNLYIVPILLLVDVLHAGLGCLVGYYVPGKLFKWNEAQRRAGLFEIAIENVSITSALAFKYFGPLAATAAALYGFTQTLLVTLVIRQFKAKDARIMQKGIEDTPKI
jgi:bile acid:Na+ symporter, BASS family